MLESRVAKQPNATPFVFASTVTVGTALFHSLITGGKQGKCRNLRALADHRPSRCYHHYSAVSITSPVFATRPHSTSKVGRRSPVRFV